MMRNRSWMFAGVALALVIELVPAAVSAQVREPRQAGQPLLVIDGVPLQGITADHPAVLRLIRHAIESIEVVKGHAAVELHGPAAADGVVAIRLKSEFARQLGAFEGANRDVTAPLAGQSERPILIIDGVIMPSELMKLLNPEDIERIEVLKGPAAVLEYGERARAGVIHVTTRRQQPR